MGCSCDLDIDYFVTVLKETKPKARKEHICGECRTIIKPGEKYERQDTVSENGFVTYKTCLTCVEIRDKYFNNWCYGSIWDDFVYCYGDMSLSDFEKFTPKTQQKILEMI